MKSLPTRPVWPISGAPTSLSYSFGESPTPIFISPSPSTCDLRPGMLRFMSLKRGIGPRSTSLLMSLGLCLRASDCENAWQVGLARRAENACCLFSPPFLNRSAIGWPNMCWCQEYKSAHRTRLAKQYSVYAIEVMLHARSQGPAYVGSRLWLEPKSGRSAICLKLFLRTRRSRARPREQTLAPRRNGCWRIDFH
jgi:hypothetical protein